MKHKILIALALLVSVPVFSQTYVSDADHIHLMYSKDGSARFYSWDHKSDTDRKITVYDTDFSVLKEIVLKPLTRTTYTMRQERAESGQTTYLADRNDLFTLDEGVGADDILNYLKEEHSREFKQVEAAAGDSVSIYFYADESDTTWIDEFYHKYDEFGTAYPRVYYTYSSDDRILWWNITELVTEYKGDWVTVKSDTSTYSGTYLDEYDIIRVEDGKFLSLVTNDEMTYCLSNTLFDDDPDTYEYILPIYAQGAFEEDDYYGSDRDGDGEPDTRRMTSYSEVVGYAIYSNETKIAELKFPQEYSGGIYKFYHIDDKIFFSCESGVYRYDKATSSVQMVSEHANKGGIRKNKNMVEIELPAECDGACEVRVVSMQGQLMHRTLVDGGQTTVSLDTRRFADGVYNISVIKDGKVLGGGKVLVK